jgi:lantibiotic leader peptide-processing serine protease
MLCQKVLFSVAITIIATIALSFPGSPLFPQAIATKVSAQSGGTRYVVSYDPNSASNSAAVKAIAGAGGVVLDNHQEIGVLVVDSANPDFASLVAATQGLRAAQDIVMNWLPQDQVDTGHLMSANAPEPGVQGLPQNAALLGNQWNLFRTQTNLAWNVTLGSSSVKVAVLDTGICAHQQDMVGKVRADLSISFITEPASCDPAVAPPCVGCPAWEDRNFHGTHVAGLISSNNLGTASVAPNVQLIAVKVLSCTGSGPFSAVINGILYAANVGADVINMSLGAFIPKNVLQDPGLAPLLDALQKAIVHAQKNEGCLVVSAAGNNGANFDVFPGNKFINVPSQLGGMSIGSTTIADLRSNFSNFGVSGMTMSAPGGGAPVTGFPNNTVNNFVLAPCSAHSVVIPPCAPGTFYLFVQGTSQATPHVAGAAALVASQLSTPPRGSWVAPVLIRDKLVTRSDDLGTKGVDPSFGAGRLNTLRAVSP